MACSTTRTRTAATVMITMTSVLCVLATLVAMGGLPATLPKALSKYKVSISIQFGPDDRGFELNEQTLGAGEVAVPLTQLSNLTSDHVIGPVRSPSLLKNRGPSTEGCKSTKIFGQSKSVPVQIVQVGVPRTGSTFQFTLLCAMGAPPTRKGRLPISRKSDRTQEAWISSFENTPEREQVAKKDAHAREHTRLLFW